MIYEGKNSFLFFSVVVGVVSGELDIDLGEVRRGLLISGIELYKKIMIVFWGLFSGIGCRVG